jgi:hypothetical protein
MEDIAKLYIDFETSTKSALGGGPVCHFQSKEIKCYYTCSPSASILFVILTDMLQYIDSHNIFDCINTKSLLLLDGHHSRMDLEFLEYINTPAHKWNVCIGVPYATHLWQVADSSQINRKLKIEIAKDKCEYMQNKTKNTTGMVITNIVPMVKGAFCRSFSIVKNSKKAIAEQGWGPALNYCLLLDPNLSQHPKDGPVFNRIRQQLLPPQ